MVTDSNDVLCILVAIFGLWQWRLYARIEKAEKRIIADLNESRKNDTASK